MAATFFDGRTTQKLLTHIGQGTDEEALRARNTEFAGFTTDFDVFGNGHPGQHIATIFFPVDGELIMPVLDRSANKIKLEVYAKGQLRLVVSTGRDGVSGRIAVVHYDSLKIKSDAVIYENPFDHDKELKDPKAI